jgi:hypothetical protein
VPIRTQAPGELEIVSAPQATQSPERLTIRERIFGKKAAPQREILNPKIFSEDAKVPMGQKFETIAKQLSEANQGLKQITRRDRIIKSSNEFLDRGSSLNKGSRFGFATSEIPTSKIPSSNIPSAQPSSISDLSSKLSPSEVKTSSIPSSPTPSSVSTSRVPSTPKPSTPSTIPKPSKPSPSTFKSRISKISSSSGPSSITNIEQSFFESGSSSSSSTNFRETSRSSTGSFGFVPPSFGERSRKRLPKLRPQPKGYKPTLFSSVFKIKGARSAAGELTGFGVRPLQNTNIFSRKSSKKVKKRKK